MSPVERIARILSRIMDQFTLEKRDKTLPALYDAALDDREISSTWELDRACFERGLLEFARQALQRNPKIIRREQTRAQRLLDLNVPYNQQKIILELNMDNARCPLRKNAYIDLYGPKRGSWQEIASAAEAYDPQIKAMQRVRNLLLRLAQLVRNEDERKQR